VPVCVWLAVPVCAEEGVPVCVEEDVPVCVFEVVPVCVLEGVPVCVLDDVPDTEAVIEADTPGVSDDVIAGVCVFDGTGRIHTLTLDSAIAVLLPDERVPNSIRVASDQGILTEMERQAV